MPKSKISRQIHKCLNKYINMLLDVPKMILNLNVGINECIKHDTSGAFNRIFTHILFPFVFGIFILLIMF